MYEEQTDYAEKTLPEGAAVMVEVETNALAKQLELLEQRLSMVLRSPYDRAERSSDMPEPSTQLRSLAMRLGQLNSRLGEIIDRIDL